MRCHSRATVWISQRSHSSAVREVPVGWISHRQVLLHILYGHTGSVQGVCHHCLQGPLSTAALQQNTAGLTAVPRPHTATGRKEAELPLLLDKWWPPPCAW